MLASACSNGKLKKWFSLHPGIEIFFQKIRTLQCEMPSAIKYPTLGARSLIQFFHCPSFLKKDLQNLRCYAGILSNPI